MIRHLGMAVTFLTRIPLTQSEPNPIAAPWVGVWFPVAGVLIGGAVGSVYWTSAHVLPAIPSAALAVAFGVLVTGGFHEDGLADTFDALGGGSDREAVLRIFKDSALGTFGVAALTLSILLRVTLVGSLGATAGLFTLMAAHVLGRGVAAATMGFATPVISGLASSFMQVFTRTHAIVVGALGLVIGSLLVGLPALIGFAVTTMVAVALGRWATTKMGGVSGDVLGAVEQFGEIAVLMAVVATADRWSIPWWA